MPIPVPIRGFELRLTGALLLLSLVGTAACSAPLDDTRELEIEAPDTAVMVTENQMAGYLESRVDIADDKFTALAEAFPESAWGWRPMEGVRSFGEVVQHVAADNWYGGALLGIATPDDIPVDSTSASVRAFQERSVERDEALEDLRRSFEFLHMALDSTRAELEHTTVLRTEEVTYGDIWVRLITHLHEHLGQGIAYARANEIVPPWSR